MTSEYQYHITPPNNGVPSREILSTFRPSIDQASLLHIAGIQSFNLKTGKTGGPIRSDFGFKKNASSVQTFGTGG